MTGGLVRNQNLVGDAFAVGDDNTKALLVVITPDDLLVASLQYLDDDAFFATATIDTRHPSQHLIAIEQLLHLAAIEEQISGAILRNKKAEAVLVALHLALDKAHVARQPEDTTAITDNLPVAAHRIEAPPQCLDRLLILEPQLLTQGSVANRLANLLQVLEDKFPAGNRIGVFFRFAPGEGIPGFTVF